MDYSYEEIRLRVEEMKRDQRFNEVTTLGILAFSTTVLAFTAVNTIELRSFKYLYYVPMLVNANAWGGWLLYSYQALRMPDVDGHTDDPRDTLRRFSYTKRRAGLRLLAIDFLSILSVLMSLTVFLFPIGFQ